MLAAGILFKIYPFDSGNLIKYCGLWFMKQK